MTPRSNRPQWDGSASRLRVYEECPRRWRHRYVDRWPEPPEADGSAARVGKLVHAALEVVGRERIALDDPNPADAAELLRALGGAIPDSGATTAEIDDARELLESLAPFDLAEGGRILAVEHPFTVEIDGARWGGYMDLVRVREDVLEVIDWKTGGNVPTPEETALNPQVLLYLAAAWADDTLATEARRVECRLVYVATGQARRVRWTRERDELIRGRCAAATRAWARVRDRARVGEHCRFCPFRERCRDYRTHLDALEQVTDPPSARDLPLPELLRERARLREVERLAEGRRKDLDDDLRRRMRAADRDSIEVGGFRAGFRSRRTSTWDVALIPDLAAALERDPYELLRPLVSIRAGALRKLTKDNPEAAALADRYRTDRDVRYLDVRATQGGPF